MQVYFYFPIGKVLIYVFTIVFHSYLLVRATLGNQFLLSALLVIPVVSVTVVLVKFLRRTVIKINSGASNLEIATLFKRFTINYSEVRQEGNFLKTKAGDFRIFPAKAGLLYQQLKSKSLEENGPGN